MTRLTRHTALALIVLCLGWTPAAAQDEPIRFTVTAPVADMHSAPSADAGVVSQATFGSGVVLVEAGSGWTKVRTSDHYEGWLRTADIRPVTMVRAGRGSAAMVESLFASLFREPDIEKHAPIVTIPYGSEVEVTGEQETPDGVFYSVRLPDGGVAWVPGADVVIGANPLSIAETIGLARRFVGLPYRWGGTSAFGFDCSGFTQMLMRRRGVPLPRDSRPQSQWEGLAPVERGALEPGDLLFFGSTPGKINHTGMYTGNCEFIHSTRRGRPGVQIGCLDDEPWATQFITARRVK